MGKPESELPGQPEERNDRNEPDGIEAPPQVVYRRTDAANPEHTRVAGPASGPGSRRELAPGVTPLVIGFTLLLIVISVLGFLSLRRVDDVGFQVLDLERVHPARATLLLQLLLAL